MPYADLPGVQLWYTDSGGSGTPVILLHAVSGNTESWVYQTPVFTKAGYRCIAYDRKGWGRSRPQPGGEQAGSAAEDLHNLANHLGLERFHLVGTAAGAAPALDYVLSHPERVRSLVLADCGAGGSEEPEYLEMRRNYRPPEINALPVELRELSAGYRATDPAGARRWLDIEHSSRHEERGAPGQRARNPMSFATLKTLRVPTLMLCGDADLVTPPALMRLSAAHIPDCRFETVPEAGHAAFWEQPDIWNRIVIEFIGRHLDPSYSQVI